MGVGFLMYLAFFGKSDSYRKKYVTKTADFKIIDQYYIVDTFTEYFIENTQGEEESPNYVYVKAFSTDTDYVYIKQHFPDMKLDTETYYMEEDDYKVGYTEYDTKDKFGDTYLLFVMIFTFNQLIIFMPLFLLRGLINMIKK